MRLEEGGAVIITHTRWDMEDLAGQLLQLMASDEPDADQWTVVMLPEIALKANEYPQNEEQFNENLRRGIYVPMEDQLGRKPGDVLWPQKYPPAVVRKKHANALEFESAAQFQQMPRLETGEIFNDGDFGYVDRAPSGLQWFAYVDLALGKTETSDFNAVGPVAMDNDGVLYIRDVFKMRAIDEFLKMLKTWMLDDREQGTIWGIENHGFQSQVVKDFLADKRLASVAIGGIDIPWKDKVEGARPWAIRGKHGLVKLVRGSWNQSFIRTASGFPGVAHDDEIDTVSGGNYMVANHAVGTSRTASSEAVVVSAEELFAAVSS